MKEKFNEKVIPVILKFINTKGIQSIKNGMVTSMSPLIIGSIFLILSNFPVKAVVDVLESTGIKAVLDRKSTRLNSSHASKSRMPSSA